MGLRDEIASDVPEIISDLADGNTEESTFTWAGAVYSCGATTETRGLILDTTGNPEKITLALLVKLADFPNRVPPGSGSKLTWNSKTYKVDERGVRYLHGAAAWLYCVDFKSSAK